MWYLWGKNKNTKIKKPFEALWAIDLYHCIEIGVWFRRS